MVGFAFGWGVCHVLAPSNPDAPMLLNDQKSSMGSFTNDDEFPILPLIGPDATAPDIELHAISQLVPIEEDTAHPSSFPVSWPTTVKYHHVFPICYGASFALATNIRHWRFTMPSRGISTLRTSAWSAVP